MPLAPFTLRSLIKRGIDKSDVLPLFSQMLNGVEAAHLRGVTHRDLKPENVLVDAAGVVKIADFGIAHFEEDALHTAIETTPQERLANWEYAAPEQRRPGQTVDLRADIYSLGLMLNELFTLQVPHGADPITIASVAPEYTYLDDIATAMRQNSPNKRPISLSEVKNLLIARGNDFVQQQKLDALRQTVIPTSQVSDPLIDDPIHVTGVAYRNGDLIFTISQSPNGRWLQRFQNMGGAMQQLWEVGQNTFALPGTLLQFL